MADNKLAKSAAVLMLNEVDNHQVKELGLSSGRDLEDHLGKS
jgi:hypothetical protein